MAMAPPAALRRTAGPMGALPSRALPQPQPMRATRTETTVTGRRQAWGGSTMASSGRSAPAVKETKLAQAACQGLASSSGSMPSSTRAWAPSASRSVSCSATSRARSWGMPRSWRRPVSSSSSAWGVVASSSRSRARAACSESRWVLTDTYSPAAMDREPASSPARPAVRRAERELVAPATPTTRPAVETTPSLAPRTAARSQLSLAPRQSWWGSAGCGPAPSASPGVESLSGMERSVSFRGGCAYGTQAGPRRGGDAPGPGSAGRLHTGAAGCGRSKEAGSGCLVVQAGRMRHALEVGEGVLLDLADAFAGEAVFLADLREGAFATVHDAVAGADDRRGAVVEAVDQAVEFLAAQHHQHGVLRGRRGAVLHEVAELGLAFGVHRHVEGHRVTRPVEDVGNALRGGVELRGDLVGLRVAAVLAVELALHTPDAA